MGDYFILKYGTLTVGWDCEGSWFIDLSDPINSNESTDSFKGLCGNYDGDPSSEILLFLNNTYFNRNQFKDLFC